MQIVCIDIAFVFHQFAHVGAFAARCGAAVKHSHAWLRAHRFSHKHGALILHRQITVPVPGGQRQIAAAFDHYAVGADQRRRSCKSRFKHLFQQRIAADHGKIHTHTGRRRLIVRSAHCFSGIQSILRSPLLDHPQGMGMEDRNPLLRTDVLWQYRKLPGTQYAAKYTIHHARYSLMPAFLGDIHCLVNGGMRRNPVQIHDLIQA
ncbi:hypothetical protein D3C75_979620 [compost metagenome]